MTKKKVFHFLLSFQFFFSFSLFNSSIAFATPSPKEKVAKTKKLKTTIVGTGCFWCTQADIEKLKGIQSALPGYSGGLLKNPTYKNHDGHIEVVKVTYDPSIITFEKLIKTIWLQQIPTDNSGSFCDRGYSYRNVFFYETPDEEKILKKTKNTLEKVLNTKVHTLIKKRSFFTLAEKYHIHYAQKNPFRYKYYRWNCQRDQTLKKFWKSTIKKELKDWPITPLQGPAN